MQARIRCSHARKRTGCVTCKTRHVRCGEEKPTCQNCKRLSRECLYVEPDDAAKSKRPTKPKITFKAVTFPVAPSIRPRVSVKRAGSREPRVFDFFCQRTIPNLSRFFPSEFWTYDVPQMCESVPAIRHCVLALSSLHLDAHERDQEIGITDSGSRCLTSTSSSHYLHAVSCLRRAIDTTTTERSPLEVALVASTLLAIYESLLGCGKQSRIHIHHGIRLALQSQSDGVNTRIFLPTVRLLGSFKLSQRLQSLEGDTAAERPFDSIFMDLMSVRHTNSVLEGMTLRTLGLNHAVVRFVADCGSGKFTGRMETGKSMQGHLLDLVEDCRRDLAEGDYSDGSSAKILQAQLELTWVILRCGMDGRQTSYDSYTRNFETILNLVESVLVQRSHVNQLPIAFSIDLGFIPLLVYVARLCRHPILRRKAIQMLTMCPSTDGNWLRQRAITAARAVHRFEGQCGDDEMVHSIPEERRVHHILFDDLNSETVKLDQSMRITLMTRPRTDMIGYHPTTFRIPVEHFVNEDVPKLMMAKILASVPKYLRDLMRKC